MSAGPEVLEKMPKAELHLHLEGTIAPGTLWAMAERNGVALPAGTLAELEALYSFESFERFIELWLAMCACLRTEADYEHMVDAFLADCERQHIRYVEAHFTPYNHERFGIGGQRALDVVTKRLEAAERRGVCVRLICDIPSESVPESGPWTADFLEAQANPILVAIGLGGPEEGFPRTLVAPVFERARRAGYPAVAHAGETGGADHVRQAVEVLKVRRVQHGVRAVEDPAVVALLAEREICCDVTLTSNECLTPFKDLASHPIRTLLDAGVPVSLGSDDPPFFGTDLNREYRRAHEEVGLSVEELWQLDLNGLRYGLAETGLRRRLRAEFEARGRSRGGARTSGEAGRTGRFSRRSSSGSLLRCTGGATAMDFGTLFAGMLAYAVSALLATLLVFVGYRVSVSLTARVDEERLLLAGNRSVAITLGAVLLAQAVLLRHALFPIMVMLRGLFLEPFDLARLVAVVGHCGALLVTIGVVSIGSVLMAAWLFARLTGSIPEMEEIAGDNAAVALFFAFAVLAITLILDRGVEDLARSLLPADRSGIVHVP